MANTTFPSPEFRVEGSKVVDVNAEKNRKRIIIFHRDVVLPVDNAKNYLESLLKMFKT